MDGFSAFIDGLQKAAAAEDPDPDPDFDPAGHLPSGQALLACIRCACLVPDTPECRELHLNWHQRLEL